MMDEKESKVYSAEDTEMLPEYDFDSPEVQQGRTYERLRQERGRRFLTPDLAEHFPDDASVNAALAELLRLKREKA
jgi:hypothetical protein